MAHPAAASAEIMRVLAHELRQPLSTIESIAYYLTLILPQDEKVREQLDRIQQLVEQSNWMLTSSQLLSDAIPASSGPVSLGALLENLLLANFDVHIDPALPAVHGDAALLRTLLENLLTLFRQFGSRCIFRVLREERGVFIELTAAVPGHRGESSLGAGSSLSLQGARRVVDALGGSLDVAIHPADGIRLRVMLT
jgi:signal transduction histidine kinase